MAVKVRVDRAAGTIILDRAEKRNALSRRVVAAIAEALDDLHLERRVRAVVLTGAGSAFSSGMDLDEMRTAGDEPDAFELWRQDAVAYRDLIDKMLRFPKPLVAAVNGPAVAGGAGLALACDMAIASEEATFGFPEPRRGIVSGLVAPLLAFRLGAGVAGYLMLTARLIDAHEAQRRGIFHEVVMAEQVWARAAQIAEHCAECAPEALQLTKRMLNETIGETLMTQLTMGAMTSATSRTTEAAAEGLQAFLEKRLPEWDRPERAPE